MKKTIILTLGAVVAVLIAGYLTGAEDPPATTTHAAQVMQQPMQQPMTQPMQQPMTLPMQQPAGTAEISESFLILTACPMCHTCPVCQANCGTQHAMKCCVGKAKQVTNCEGEECCDEPALVRHVMTNKADAVKHAASHTRQQTAGQGASQTATPTVVQTDSGYLIIQTGN